MRVAVPVKIFGDEIGLEADRVENLRAAIGLVGGDAHLGHHLEQALVDRLDVALDDLLLVELLRQVVLHRDQRLEGEIGIDRLGAVAGEAGEVVHLARLAGFDHEPDRGAQALRGSDDDAPPRRRAATASECGPAPARRSDRMMMLMPSRTAASARAHSASSASFEAGGAMLGRPGGVEDARLEMSVADLGDRRGSFPGLRW